MNQLNDGIWQLKRSIPGLDMNKAYKNNAMFKSVHERFHTKTKHFQLF